MLNYSGVSRLPRPEWSGHAFQGRKPALADNLLEIFVAPIFLVAEVFFALGPKREMLRKIGARLQQASSAK